VPYVAFLMALGGYGLRCRCRGRFLTFLGCLMPWLAFITLPHKLVCCSQLLLLWAGINSAWGVAPCNTVTWLKQMGMVILFLLCLVLLTEHRHIGA